MSKEILRTFWGKYSDCILTTIRQNFAKKKSQGFTVIEMLIVISIIGILATLSIGSYQNTRESAELSMQIDAFMDEVRNQKTIASNSNDKCYGLHISKTEILEIESNYLNPYNKCSPQITTKSSNLKISANEIKRDEQVKELKEIDILFYPPSGDSFLPSLDQTGIDSSETIYFKFKLGSKTNEQIVSFNSTNSSVQKITTKPLVSSSKTSILNNSSTTNSSSTTNTTSSIPVSNTNTNTNLSNSNYTSFPSSNDSTSPSTNTSTISNTISSSSNSNNISQNTEVPDLKIQYENTPEEFHKKNPVSFVLIILASIILGTYLTRSKQ